VFANEEKNLLHIPDDAIIDFLAKLILADSSLEAKFIKKGIIMRWFYLRKETLYEPSPFSALAPLLIHSSRRVPKSIPQILISARIAYLLSRGFRFPFDFVSALKSLFLATQEGSDAFKSTCRSIAKGIYENLKKRALRTSIEQILTQGFMDLRGFSSFSALANLILEYSSLNSISWHEVRNFIMETTKTALRRSVKPQIKKELTTLQKIDFGSPKESAVDVKGFERLLREYYEQHRQVYDMTASAYSSTKPIFEYKKEISDLENKIELVSRSYKHILTTIDPNILKDPLLQFIAKSTLYLVHEAASKTDLPTQQRIAQLTYEFLESEINALKAIDSKPDLKEFVVKEIKHLSQILRIQENYIHQIQYHSNKKQGIISLGWSVNCIKNLIREWVIIPRDLYRKHPSFKHPKLAAASRRADLRNFFLLAAIRQLEIDSLINAYEKLYEYFPKPIPPHKSSLLVDSTALVEFLLINSQ
ncbi:MAG: hypothetical protein ACFFBD_30405, partial [Candidatus Hodarchaeota archaeon]